MTKYSALTKTKIAEKFMDLGNFAVVALIFGQAFSGYPFDPKLALFGLFALAFLYAFGLYLMKGKK